MILEECDMEFCLELGAEIAQDENFGSAIHRLETGEALLDTEKEAVERLPLKPDADANENPTKNETETNLPLCWLNEHCLYHGKPFQLRPSHLQYVLYFLIR